MDYIREEFMRQQNALVALMHSDISGIENRDPQVEQQVKVYEEFIENAHENRAAYGETPGDFISMQAIPNMEYHQERTAEYRGLGQKMKKDGRPNVSERLKEEQSAKWNSFIGEIEGTWEYSSPVPSYDRNDYSVQRGTKNAQAISRIIQRDARRYDGGFSIY